MYVFIYLCIFNVYVVIHKEKKIMKIIIYDVNEKKINIFSFSVITSNDVKSVFLKTNAFQYDGSRIVLIVKMYAIEFE